MDFTSVVIIIQLIFLEGVLSVDNAAVLGAMVAHLPQNQPIPWPHWLRFMKPLGDKLGMQREAALKVGLLGAYLGRGLMLLLATTIIQYQWIRIFGAAYLLYLGFEHLGHLHDSHKADDKKSKAIEGGFWATVASLELADLAFSVDNVIAAVALSSETWVLLAGVAIGIVIMRFAAQIFTRMIAWEPALGTGAYLLLVSIGVQLLLKEYLHIHLGEIVQFFVSAGILGLTVLVARTPVLLSLARFFRPTLVVFAWLNQLVHSAKSLVLMPLQRTRQS